jgi:hypothetical protein
MMHRGGMLRREALYLNSIGPNDRVKGFAKVALH